MKGFGDSYKSKKKNKNTNLFKEQIINRALQYHAKGNISQAAKYYKYCINKGFKDHRVFSNYGVILSNLGNLKEAEICHRKAIKLAPTFADAHCNLGNVLIDLGNLIEAELFTRKAIEISPNLVIAHSNLGIILKNLGKLKEAEISYRKAIELKPNYAGAHTNLGNVLKKLDKLKEAELYHRKAIELKPNYAEAYTNLGNVLFDLGNLKEAELCHRKAIELKPDFAGAYTNLGNVLIDLGKLKEAELYILKALEMNPNLSMPYFSLSTLKYFNKNKIWREKLFSKNLLNNQLNKDKVYIYFARANTLHKESNYKESSKYLQIGNNLKYQLYSSNIENLINESKELLFESNKKVKNEKKLTNCPESIFIVGMPRSGSTLLESILSMNNNVDDLGEINILEESFLSCKKPEQKLTLAELYLRKTNIYCKKKRSTTNKWLYNYQYAGIICCLIPNAKIIHSYRNPLDNILSIYRANFAKGNEYSTRLVDCARVYLDQEKVMTEYKKKFREKIYDLNYDALVSDPNKEIKSLISWLGWKWDDQYLSPHLNPRSVTTASNIQVRFPINSNSVGGWKNYKEMLKPAMEIITQNDKYKYLKY